MSTLPRRDRWVIALVVLMLAALITGFAASAPALRKEAATGETEIAASRSEPSDGNGEIPSAAPAPAVHTDPGGMTINAEVGR
ncbi:MAG: hypothetical protein U1F43_36105 [Myxococcota bacterium]